MSWTDADIAPATDSWSDENVAAPVVAPRKQALPKAVAQPQYVSNESGHIIRLGKTIGRMPFEIGRSLITLLGGTPRDNPIQSQGEGYDMASEFALTALPGAAAAGAVTKIPMLGKALASPAVRTAALEALEGGVDGVTSAALKAPV